MELDLKPAIAFGTLLREDPEASRYYDGCTPAQRQEIILRLHQIPIEEMPAFVAGLAATAPD